MGLEEFWRPRLGCSHEGTDWEHVLQTLRSYRLLNPGSEWRLHPVWFDHSAMGDLLGEDFSIAAKNTLYRCLDRLLEQKGGTLQFFARAMGRPFRGEVRRVALRSDEHVF